MNESTRPDGGTQRGGPETYEVYRYSDDLGGDYERPHLHETTDDLAEAQAHVAHWGGHVRRVSDGATWDPGTERWFGGSRGGADR